MAEVFFDNPPILSGTEKDQLTQLQRYLNAMSEKLNTALMSISIEQMDTETQQVIRTAGGEKAESQYNALKSLIIKSAEIVRNEMEEIRTELNGEIEYVSSEFGTLTQSMQNDIAANAQGISQNITWIETLQTLEGQSADFRTRMESHIFAGILGYDPDTGNPITGISIGENITNNDGTENVSQRTATFTPTRLSFYLNQTEVAYFANNVFHIANGEILKNLKIGNHTWQVLAGGALALVAGSST